MITTGSFSKALIGGKTMKKKTQTLANALKADKKLDAKMTVPQMKQDIASDKKLLAKKQAAAKKGKK